MHLLFLHLQTICCLQSLLFSYLQIYQKLVYRHIFCNNFHYSSIPDTSDSQITQSETPQTPSPNLIVSTPVVHASSSQEISIDAETIQHHIYNFIGPYPYDPLEGFQWVPNGWKLEKKEKNVSFDEIFVGKIRSITKNSGKKGRGNVDLQGKVSTFKSEFNYAFSRLILTWSIFCNFYRSRVYLQDMIGEVYQKIFYQQN